LYRGLGVSLCSAVPTIAVNFALFDEFSRIYGDLGLQSTPFLHALTAGASAGIVASSLLFPIDLIRRQMQMVGLGGRPRVYGSLGQ
ncbi:unnamed protein product, partial [Polarella glacialis]